MQDFHDQYQEEMDAVQAQFHENEQNKQQQISHLTHEIELKDQKIQQLQDYVKDSVDSIKNQNSEQLKVHLDLFNQERKELLQKMESMQAGNTSLERQVSALQKDIQRKDEDIQGL